MRRILTFVCLLFVFFCSRTGSPTPLAPCLSPIEKVEAFQRSISYDSVHLVMVNKSKYKVSNCLEIELNLPLVA